MQGGRSAGRPGSDTGRPGRPGVIPAFAGGIETGWPGPRRVQVARDQHRPPAGVGPLLEPARQALPLTGVAVPSVVMEDLTVEVGVAVGEQRVAQPVDGRGRRSELTTTPLATMAQGREVLSRRSRDQARCSSPSSDRVGSWRGLDPLLPAWRSRPVRRVSSNSSSTRSPTARDRQVTRGSAGSASRAGSHSWRARAAAAALAGTHPGSPGRAPWPRPVRRRRRSRGRSRWRSSDDAGAGPAGPGPHASAPGGLDSRRGSPPAVAVGVGAAHQAQARCPVGASGSVRVRPTGDWAPSAAKRYQKVVAAARPSTSTTRVWSCSGPVRARPEATMSSRAGSRATTHSPSVAPQRLVHSSTPDEGARTRRPSDRTRPSPSGSPPAGHPERVTPSGSPRAGQVQGRRSLAWREWRH